MSGKTTEDLTKLRAELVNRRRREAYFVRGAHQDEQLAKLVHVHLAIEAIDELISEGAGEAETEYPKR